MFVIISEINALNWVSNLRPPASEARSLSTRVGGRFILYDFVLSLSCSSVLLWALPSSFLLITLHIPLFSLSCQSFKSYLKQIFLGISSFYIIFCIYTVFFILVYFVGFTSVLNYHEIKCLKATSSDSS